jgi:predicted kinase
MSPIAVACWCGKLNCRSHKPEVFLVCGPPGSGKTTYVKEHRRPGDLAFDFDEIMATITGLPLYQRVPDALNFVMRMRDGFMEAAGKDSSVRAVWIISANHNRNEVQTLRAELGATLINLDVPEKICIERTKDRGKEWAGIVHDWFVRH